VRVLIRTHVARFDGIDGVGESLSVGDVDIEGSVSKESPRPRLAESLKQRRGQRPGMAWRH
jgi:hypothetical protein